jgi:hypothetical protein
MRLRGLLRFALILFLAALGITSQAQDVNGARTKCTEFGFKENTKSHEECVKQFLNSMGSAKTAPVKKPISTPPESTSTDDQKEEDYWKEAKSVGNKEAFEAYLKFYPRGRYVGLANARITQLSKLDSAKVENDQKPYENQKNRPCSTTITSKDWTNCVGTYYFTEENQWKGNIYVGEFKNGTFNGQGTYTFSKWGHKYIGEWKDGMRNGQGTLTLSDGERYVGNWKDGKLNGQGTTIFSNGDKHVGEYRDGESNGLGTYYHLAENQSKGDIYVGEYVGDKRNGQGTYTFLNGEKYVGTFKNGEPNGQGTFTYINGDRYVGLMKDNKRNGYGTYYYLAENQWKGDIYVGEYKDGKFNGQGTYYYLADNQWKGYKFVGEHKDNKQNGRGILFGPSGNVIYSGNYLNGKTSP